jgi:hypothetical protein
MSITSTAASEWEGMRAVSPREAAHIMGVSLAYLYRILPELDCYHEGRARRITITSIKRRQAKLLAAAQGKRPRGWPRKVQPQQPAAPAEAQGA